MGMELVLCPACGTENAIYWSACLKCGVELFDATGADLTTDEEVPGDPHQCRKEAGNGHGQKSRRNTS